MGEVRVRRVRTVLIWLALAAAVVVPLVPAVTSPLLAYRDPLYIIAGFAGIGALLVLLVQPALAAGLLPGLGVLQSRWIHRVTGLALVILVLAHVIGLWITTPPDVIDALLFASPTPFSLWGVIAMWAVFAAALTVALRRRLRLSPRRTQLIHTGFVLIVVAGSVLHSLLIIGTMETVTKTILCLLVVLVTAKAVFERWKSRSR